MMCSFYGTKTAGQQHGGWIELRDSQMAYCVRNLLWKIAMEKHVDIFGVMILNSMYDK